MKKVVITCGLISGLITTLTMVLSTTFCSGDLNYEGSMLIGYASMVLALSLVFIGIKSYRDKFSNGHISFGKAFLTGLYISLIASTIYVVTWLFDYYFFIPDFMDRYVAHELKAAQDAGLTGAEMTKKAEQMEFYKSMYKNPILVALMTYVEILPVGIIVSLISAAILKRRKKDEESTVIPQ